MAGIYIPVMEMPENCRECLFEDQYDGYCCRINEKSYNWGLTERPSDCPLIPVPDHARLVEEDTAYDKIAEEAGEEAGNYVDMDVVGKGLENTPTIIPADKKEAE